MHAVVSFLLVSTLLVNGIVLPRSGDVTLAVKPVCGNFSGIPKDVKGGLPALSSFSSIVVFGVSE